MSAAFIIETTGARAIEARLAGLQRAFGDLEELMSGIGGYLEGATIDRFDREEAPDGSAWTKSERARRDSGKTLQDSGQLRSSIVSEADSKSVRVGTNKVYAGIHQFGFDGNVTVRGHARTIDQAFGKQLKAPVTFNVDAFERLLKMPARPFLGLSGEDEAEILAFAEDHAVRAMGGAA